MSALHTQVQAENQYWLKGNPKKDFYLLVEVKGKQAKQGTKRSPLNISLVIDRSGSMQGDKLKYVKKAVSFVIDNVNSEDYLSVVQYDSTIETLIASQKVSNKAAMKKIVERIEANSMTNLSGGMLKGYEEVSNTQKQGLVNRVLLLSDGLANEGITDEKQLELIAQKKFREMGIGLSTFGVGADFNETLMTNLAEYGGANYYFIEQPDQIPTIFAKELEGLLAVVAQNTTVKIDFPSEYFSFKQVYGYPAQLTGKQSVEIKLNDVFSEERKVVLLKFECLKEWNDTIDFHTQISHEDVLETFTRVETQHTHHLQITQDGELYAKYSNKEVLQETVMFSEMYEQALNKADKYEFEEVKAILQKAIAYLDHAFQFFAPQEDLKKLYQEIVNYASRVDEMGNMQRDEYASYQKMSKSINYLHRKRKI